MDRSVVARGVRRVLGLVTFALIAGYIYYALRVGGNPAPVLWIPALGALVNGLYNLVFTPEQAAISGDKFRRHAWVRALNLGIVPSQQGIRWSGIGQVISGTLLFVAWALSLSS